MLRFRRTNKMWLLCFRYRERNGSIVCTLATQLTSLQRSTLHISDRKTGFLYLSFQEIVTIESESGLDANGWAEDAGRCAERRARSGSGWFYKSPPISSISTLLDPLYWHWACLKCNCSFKTLLTGSVAPQPRSLGDRDESPAVFPSGWAQPGTSLHRSRSLRVAVAVLTARLN